MEKLWYSSCSNMVFPSCKRHETEIKDQGRFSSKDQICDCRLSSTDYKNTYTLNSHSSFKRKKKPQIDFTPARQSPFISIKKCLRYIRKGCFSSKKQTKKTKTQLVFSQHCLDWTQSSLMGGRKI